MHKSTRIKVIYIELRRILGNAVSSRELIKLAHAIFKSHNGHGDSVEEYGKAKERSAFFYLPVDVAMEDGGWRILANELKLLRDIDNCETPELLRLRQYVNVYLGAEWRQQIPPGSIWPPKNI